MPPVSAEEIVALEHDYRYAKTRLVRQRSHIVLLAYQLESQEQVAKVVRCSRLTVWRTLELYRQGGRAALPRPLLLKAPRAKVNLAWQKALAEAMKLGPQACGAPRPTWTAPLLARYLEGKTGIAAGERTVRRGLELLDYVCRRPTWTVRHKAEEQADYAQKKMVSKRS